jgi:hypothetical protein
VGGGARDIRPEYVASWRQSIVVRFVEELEVWLLEEGFGGAYGIGRIGDDVSDIVGSLVRCEKFEAVANEDCDFGKLSRADV